MCETLPYRVRFQLLSPALISLDFGSFKAFAVTLLMLQPQLTTADPCTAWVFEICGLTYTQICFNSKSYSTLYDPQLVESTHAEPQAQKTNCSITRGLSTAQRVYTPNPPCCSRVNRTTIHSTFMTFLKLIYFLLKDIALQNFAVFCQLL